MSHALSSAFLSLALQELQKYEQFIFADHTNMIHVENVYEEILHQSLLDETLKGEEDFLGPGGNSRYRGGPLQGDPGRPARSLNRCERGIRNRYWFLGKTEKKGEEKEGDTSLD